MGTVGQRFRPLAAAALAAMLALGGAAGTAE